MMELASRIRELTASRSDLKLVPYSEAYAPGFEDMQRRVPDTSRIRDLIGWKQEIPLDDILRAVIEHQKQHRNEQPDGE